MRLILRRLLGDDPTAAAPRDVLDWWSRHRAAVVPARTTIDQAILGGFAADRVGYAFGAGIQSALRALSMGTRAEAIASLCATEARGAHPRAIEATLRPTDGDRLVLDGKKTWSTLAPVAETLLVVASRGTDALGTRRLAVVRVDARAKGVIITPMPEAPFVPEIPHGEVALDHVEVRERDVLFGDGYDDYLKPFRTVEDVHVHAAVLGHLVRVAREHGWPRAFVEQAIAQLVGVRALALDDPRLAETHLPLAGALVAARRLYDEASEHFARTGGDVAARWVRDRELFGIAEKVRAKRTERAWERLTGAASKG